MSEEVAAGRKVDTAIVCVACLSCPPGAG